MTQPKCSSAPRLMLVLRTASAVSEGVGPTSCAWCVGSWCRRGAMASAGIAWMEHLLDCAASDSRANYLSMTLDVKHNWKAEILCRTQTYFKDSFVRGILRYITYIIQKWRGVFKKLSYHGLTERNQLDSLSHEQILLSLLFYLKVVLKETSILFFKFTKIYIKAPLAALFYLVCCTHVFIACLYRALCKLLKLC